MTYQKRDILNQIINSYMKNCEPFVSFPLLAIDKRNSLLCLTAKLSSIKKQSFQLHYRHNFPFKIHFHSSIYLGFLSYDLQHQPKFRLKSQGKRNLKLMNSLPYLFIQKILNFQSFTIKCKYYTNLSSILFLAHKGTH